MVESDEGKNKFSSENTVDMLGRTIIHIKTVLAKMYFLFLLTRIRFRKLVLSNLYSLPKQY
jgi:hypothetical protein